MSNSSLNLDKSFGIKNNETSLMCYVNLISVNFSLMLTCSSELQVRGNKIVTKANIKTNNLQFIFSSTKYPARDE